MNLLLTYFEQYPQNKAPFMHQQLAEWSKTKPLTGLTVLHHVPLVTNTLLKIACVIAAGADVIVTNPSFMRASEEAIFVLQQDNIEYVENLSSLKNKQFDLHFDCGAECYQTLASPRLGTIELTASGDHIFRQDALSFPVVSIDQTQTKQLETLFGSAESCHTAIKQLTRCDVAKKSWLIFGFGKIGRGLCFYCVEHNIPITVVDIDPNVRLAATQLGVHAIDPQNMIALGNAIAKAEIIVTATGKKSLLSQYPKTWFAHKILANMGALDEYGDQFAKNEVLNDKLPVNFTLSDPTPIQFIDPEFYAHNVAALELLNNALPNGIKDLSPQIDQTIIRQWCQYHGANQKELEKWFI